MGDSLESVIARIPGYAGYKAAEQNTQQRELGDLQKAHTLQSILAQIQAQELNKQFAGAMSSGGGTPEQLDTLATKLAAGGHPGAAALSGLADKRRKSIADAATLKTIQTPAASPVQSAPDPEGLKMVANTGDTTIPGTNWTNPSAAQVPPEERAAFDKVLNAARTTNAAARGEGGLFATLMQSEVPAIANQAKLYQQQANVSDPRSVSPTHWVDLQKTLAAQESGILERRTATADRIARAKGDESAGLSEQYVTDQTYKKNVDYWASLIAQGGTLPPRFAQSGSGKKMMPDILNVVPTIGKGDSREMLANQVDLTGQKSEARAVGTRSAAVEMAAGEAREMMPILTQASEAFKRTGYQPINRVLKSYQDNTGSVESRNFGAALNTFINVYARAVSPSGVATVSDKDHAREVLSTADSHEQLIGLLKVLDQEMVAAQNAPRRVRDAQRAGMTGATPAGHTAPAPNAKRMKFDSQGNLVP